MGKPSEKFPMKMYLQASTFIATYPRIKSMSRVGQGFAHLYEFLYYKYKLLPSYDLRCGMMTSQ